MRIDSRLFWLPKDIGYENEYEDAGALDAAAGVAAIADGVGTAIFSRQWARLLVDGVAKQPPDVNDASFWEWLTTLRTAWRESIDFTKLSFAQMGKLRQCGGAFSTLLWLNWFADEHDANRIQWRAVGLGDCGLFHVRDNQKLLVWPFAASADLAADPQSVCSVDLRRDQNLTFVHEQGEAQLGDIIVLCTDAWYGWALRQLETEQPVPWDKLFDWSDEDFKQHVMELRNGDGIRIDDTTLIVLKLVPEPVEPVIGESTELSAIVAMEAEMSEAVSVAEVPQEAVVVTPRAPEPVHELVASAVTHDEAVQPPGQVDHEQ